MTWFLHMLSDFPTEKMIQFLFKTSEPNRCYKGKEPAFLVLIIFSQLLKMKEERH